jgi:hypothetical protein
MTGQYPKDRRDKDHQSQKPVQGNTRDHARSLCKCRHRARRVRRLWYIGGKIIRFGKRSMAAKGFDAA